MKNKHSFFGLLIVCRSHLPPFMDWGGGPKNGSPAGVISGRWSVPHNQSPYNPIILLYLRYDKNMTYYE
jgi:hypothetical protein